MDSSPERAAISTANPKMVCPSCVCSSIRAEVISLVKEAENRVFSNITAQLRNKAVILKAYLERYIESLSLLQSWLQTLNHMTSWNRFQVHHCHSNPNLLSRRLLKRPLLFIQLTNQWNGQRKRSTLKLASLMYLMKKVKTPANIGRWCTLIDVPN